MEATVRKWCPKCGRWWNSSIRSESTVQECPTHVLHKPEPLFRRIGRANK